MASRWIGTFEERMRNFDEKVSKVDGGQAISIKLRVTEQCFERHHVKETWRLIDEYLSKHPPSDVPFELEEHESGPEILVYLAVVAGGLNLSASIINLVVAILKARSEGAQKGDPPVVPIELIVRGLKKSGVFAEKIVIRIEAGHLPDKEEIAKLLKKVIKELFKQ